MLKPGVAAVVALTAGVVLGGCSGTPESAPTSSQAPPGSETASAPAPAEAELNGTYRKVQAISQSTTNGVPNDAGQADETYWWAFRSACLPTGCVATAVNLDDTDHTVAATPSVSDVFRFVYGGWESTSELQSPCPDQSGAVERLNKVVRYMPQADGTLTGEDTRTIVDNGCGREGNVFMFPTSLTREGDAPAGVEIADPSTVGG